jgi:penicillin amidase
MWRFFWRVGWCAMLSGCALTTLMTKGRSYPQPSSMHSLASLDARVVIDRDVYGVPHVRAETEHDMWFALGFLHAQDRLFQMDLSRRAAWGRLHEWLGAATIEVDTFHRALGWRERAESNVALCTAEEKAMLEAYTQGVNAGADSLGVLPVEYRLLKKGFDPWTVQDGLALGFLQAWNLETNSSREMAALLMREEWDVAMLDRLHRLMPEEPEVDPYWDTLRHVDIGALTPVYRSWTSALGGRPDKAEASNNWVVGPERTASGHAIVANDPHLNQSVPSLWYAVDLVGGAHRVAGATLPGLPGVPVGHNGKVAWGLTNVMADVVDYAVLERVGERGYLLSGETHELETRTYRFDLGEEGVVEREVHHTALGPVITQLEGTHLVVMRFVASELEDRMTAVLRGLMRAEKMEDAAHLAELPLMVAQNVALADTEGGWGWQAIGAVPRRKAHTGRVPYPGSDPAHGWDGWMPTLMGEREPERGYVHTANARPGVNTPSFGGDPIDVDTLTTSFLPPHRHNRLDELLSGTQNATPDDVRRMQLDVLDGVARRWIPELLEGPWELEDARAQPCRDLLMNWDYRLNPEASGGAVWAVFQQALLEEVLSESLSETELDMYFQTSGPGDSLFLNPDKDALGAETAHVERALVRTCAQLTHHQGSDPSQWSWGAMHPMKLGHPFGEQSALLSGWNMKEIPWGGSSVTVAAAAYSWGEGIRPVGGMQSLRLVMPIADLGATTLSYPGGQSGQPGHPHYRSHFEAFEKGEGVPLWTDDKEIQGEVVSSWLLVPAP